MEKLDLTKRYKSYYTAKTTPELVAFETLENEYERLMRILAF